MVWMDQYKSANATNMTENESIGMNSLQVNGDIDLLCLPLVNVFEVTVFYSLLCTCPPLVQIICSCFGPLPWGEALISVYPSFWWLQKQKTFWRHLTQILCLYTLFNVARNHLLEINFVVLELYFLLDFLSPLKSLCGMSVNYYCHYTEGSLVVSTCGKRLSETEISWFKATLVLQHTTQPQEYLLFA